MTSPFYLFFIASRPKAENISLPMLAGLPLFSNLKALMIIAHITQIKKGNGTANFRIEKNRPFSDCRKVPFKEVRRVQLSLKFNKQIYYPIPFVGSPFR